MSEVITYMAETLCLVPVDDSDPFDDQIVPDQDDPFEVFEIPTPPGAEQGLSSPDTPPEQEVCQTSKFQSMGFPM